MTSSPLNIFVLSWPGHEVNALHIEQSLVASGRTVTVIHSHTGVTTIDPPKQWVVLPDGSYYGVKFRHSLDKVTSGPMIHIQADATCEDWPGLMERCDKMFLRFPDLGLWSPDVDWTPYSLKRTRQGPIIDQYLSPVVVVDGIVWAMGEAVVKRLSELDFADNPYGWRLELFAAAYARVKNLKILHDRFARVQHPRFTGYSFEDAYRQGEQMVSQLTQQEKEALGAITGLFNRRLRREKSNPWYLSKRFLRRVLDPFYIALRRSTRTSVEP